MPRGRRLKTKVREVKALTKARIETEIKTEVAAKRKYVHKSIKKLLPTDFQGIADFVLDYIEKLISTADIVEVGGFILGLSTASQLKLDATQTLSLGLTGMFAVRGLSSMSDVTGAASIATLIFLGAGMIGPVLPGTQRAVVTMAENRMKAKELMDPDTSDERKEQLIEELKESIRSMNRGE